MHYYQHHIGDFIRDTSRLTDSQGMAYLRMLWLYYESEQPLPNNARLIAFKLGADQGVVESILEAYFRLDCEVWRHTRCDKEIAEYKAICERNRTNGKAGGRPKKTQSVSSGNRHETSQEPSRNPNQYPVTNNQDKDKVKSTGETLGAEENPVRSPSGSRLPVDWEPDESMIEFCKTERPDLFPARVADEFRDYWISQPGAKGRKTDWAATWRNWVRRQSAPRTASVGVPQHRETQAEKRSRCAAEMFSTIRGGAYERDIIDIN